MFLRLFETLRETGVPVTLREYLGFLEAVDAGLAACDAERFYYLARTAMVKDERHLDRFDRAFVELGWEPATRASAGWERSLEWRRRVERAQGS